MYHIGIYYHQHVAVSLNHAHQMYERRSNHGFFSLSFPPDAEPTAQHTAAQSEVVPPTEAQPDAPAAYSSAVLATRTFAVMGFDSEV